MNPISPDALRQLFIEARSFSYWLPQEVSETTLLEIYELMKLGPTSVNSCPARIVFVRSEAERDRLAACASSGNVHKIKTAPVTAILAYDEKFVEQLSRLSPNPAFYQMFASNRPLADVTAFRNGTLEGAYFILAARALGLDCGPMSGFDNKKVDEAFLGGTSWKSNFICSLGHGDRSKLHPRGPRLSFEEACKIV